MQPACAHLQAWPRTLLPQLEPLTCLLLPPKSSYAPHSPCQMLFLPPPPSDCVQVRNPIISTVMYLTGGGIGGPTVVTDQVRGSGGGEGL